MVNPYRPKPYHEEHFLAELRRQFDLMQKLDDDLIDRSYKLIGFVIAIYSIFASIWRITGLELNPIIAICLVISAIGLIITSARLITTESIELPNIYQDSIEYEDYDLHDENFSYWRIATSLNQGISEIEKINRSRANRYRWTLYLVIANITFLILSLAFVP